MKGIYYKIPLDFESMIAKKDTDKIPLDVSLHQYILMLATTSFGECKFDETYGSEIWEMDFDLLKTDNNLKELIAATLKKAITIHEKRLLLEDVEVFVRDYNVGTLGKRRMKKRVEISIKGLIYETSRSFFFSHSFFVGPLSY